MFAKLLQRKRRLFAITGTAAACLMVFGTVTATRSSAFTVIERQFAFDPVEINIDQTAHVVFTNTFGAQAIHITVKWTYGITGAPIGSPFDADVMPGHGVVALLPAVQMPPSTNGDCCSTPVIAIVNFSPAPGASLPLTLGQQLNASLDVLDIATQHVTLSHGLNNSLLQLAQ